jgi:hypothetical protein
MGRMMESYCESIMRRLLTWVIVIFLAVTLLGCGDPIVADMEAEHQRLGQVCQRELRQGLYAFPPSAQTEALYPAP